MITVGDDGAIWLAVVIDRTFPDPKLNESPGCPFSVYGTT